MHTIARIDWYVHCVKHAEYFQLYYDEFHLWAFGDSMHVVQIIIEHFLYMLIIEIIHASQFSNECTVLLKIQIKILSLITHRIYTKNRNFN